MIYVCVTIYNTEISLLEFLYPTQKAGTCFMFLTHNTLKVQICYKTAGIKAILWMISNFVCVSKKWNCLPIYSQRARVGNSDIKSKWFICIISTIVLQCATLLKGLFYLEDLMTQEPDRLETSRFHRRFFLATSSHHFW